MSNIQAKDNSIPFNFTGIEVLAKNLIPLSQSIPAEAQFNFEVATEVRVVEKKSVVICITNVAIKGQADQEVVASLKTGCVFIIENFNDNIHIDSESGLYHLPLDFEDLIRRLSATTTRGVLFGELKGTYLSNVVMPIIEFPTLASQGRIMI